MDVFKSFHLGLCHLQLYNRIPIALWRDVQVTFCFPLDKLAQHPYYVAAWHLLLLLPQWCLILSFCGGTTRHREIQIRLKCFLINDWENLWAQVLAISLSSIPFPQHDLPTHKNMFHNFSLWPCRGIFLSSCVLAPFSLAPMSFDTTLALTALHLESNGYNLFFFE